jgi:hypothetical protein
MDVYEVMVNLGGHVFQQCRKHNVTAAEVHVLRNIHGGAEHGKVIARTGTVTRSKRDEWNRLVGVYGEEAVTAFYGPFHSAHLPASLDEEEVKDAAPASAPTKGKGKKAQPAPVSRDDDDDGLSKLNDDD